MPIAQTYYRTFVVPNIADGYTAVAGLLTGDFTIKLFLDGAEQAHSIAVTENPAGYYTVNHTFDDNGSWQLIISNDAHKYRSEEAFDVTVLSIDDQRPKGL